eukprot:CAMPEP_0204615320 /NCGR_PEP_ID=MMETSP0717-20131115/2842_1 /ASSEMBLY_ACC=CAM_ASM_000666 /TAXON_ID=230516 /ORGANISM="Chaetoceros curvisetus" /LENGTH=57 /DNA_ID=CAMNT_0051628223 /DNA_START=34 /DNA_END=207 /DNA_ORIENTATION=+
MTTYTYNPNSTVAMMRSLELMTGSSLYFHTNKITKDVCTVIKAVSPYAVKGLPLNME